MTQLPNSEIEPTLMWWSSRVLRRSLFDGDGSVVGTVHDILLSPALPGQPPQLRGFVALVDRRRIFVHQARVDAIGRDGVHLRGGTVDLRRFNERAGEMLVVGEIIGSITSEGPVTDVGFAERPRHDGTWEVRSVATGTGSRLRRSPLVTLPWTELTALHRTDAVTGDLARLRDMHKADAAVAIRALPEQRRTELAAELDAGRLADLLEELPEHEQVQILGNLDTEDTLAVLDEMEIDDEIDLLQEMTASDRERLLAQMPAEKVTLLRSLLSYPEDTAGGMMTPEAVILNPDTTVAEAIARLRDSDLPPALTLRVFIVESPTSTPTGRFVGAVTLPRLLKEPPTHTIGDCIAEEMPSLLPSTPESEVAGLLARYDLLAVPVVDSTKRLLGVVTVDDVIVRLIGGAARP